MVTFCVGVEDFFGAEPASRAAKASPPAFLGAPPPILLPPILGEIPDGVVPADGVEPILTEVK